MIENLQASYDEVNYFSQAFYYSSPDRIQVMAHLKGLKSPNLKNASVLEIGCSMGGNIFSHAMRYKNAKIVGVDLSQKQINKAKLIAKYMQLTNIEFICKDISTIDRNFGMFDFIICHGVFSWVPKQIQLEILRVIEENLSPNGLAFISYNVYPGWKSKEVVKDYMQISCGGGATLLAKTKNAIKNSNLLLEQISQKPEFRHIAKDIESINNFKEYYIAHEYLENFNIPVYFQNFYQMLENHSLGYVCESSFKSHIMKDEEFIKSLEIDPELDYIKGEQISDFLLYRTFRESIVTHKINEINIPRNNAIKNDAVDEIYIFAKETKTENGYELAQKGQFYTGDDFEMIFKQLAEVFPKSMQVKELREKCKQIENGDFYNAISRLICLDQIFISLNPFEAGKNLTNPKINKHIAGLARYMDTCKDTESIGFSNFGYVNFGFDTFLDPMFFPLLNGQNDMEKITDILAQKVKKQSNFAFQENGNIVTDELKIKELCKKYADKTILKLYNLGLLEK